MTNDFAVRQFVVLDIKSLKKFRQRLDLKFIKLNADKISSSISFQNFECLIKVRLSEFWK